MMSLHFDNFTIVIGKNKNDNWKILDEANDNDTWLHLDDKPSPYIIIKTKNNYKLTYKNLKLAAILCKNNSKYKKINDLCVCYTLVKNVKKGEHIGEVILLEEPKIIKLK